MYEYSQTKLYKDSHHMPTVLIKENQYTTDFRFTDRNIGNKFVKVVKSWDLFGTRFSVQDDVITYSATQSGIDAYDYSKFMSLMISFLEGDFKEKE